MTGELIQVLLLATIGAVVAGCLACIPSLHVYNVMGFMIMGVHSLGRFCSFSPDLLVPLFIGMVVGFSILNSIPSILLTAPDESAIFTVLPGQKLLMKGRGAEGVRLTAVGGLGGILLLVFFFGPIAPLAMPFTNRVLRPHMHWIIWSVITFMLLSEWPRSHSSGQGGWLKFMGGWKSLAAGLLTFLLSGLLGFIIFFRSPIAVTASFQNLMPAFVGLFATPWLILSMLSRGRVPPQETAGPVRVGAAVMLRGLLAGAMGGGFAAFFPAITGGVGAMLAGHATATRNDRVFLVAQGASKTVYYTGALLLFFVPGLNMTRGGAAWLLRGLEIERSSGTYLLVLAAILVAGMVSYLLVGPLTRFTLALLQRCSCRIIASIALLVVAGLVLLMTGWQGGCVMVVATAIGMIPVLYGSRRMNCLGIILLPVACNMSGIGISVARWLGLA